MLLAALSVGATQQEAAARAGVGTDLVRDRLADPAFRRRLDALQQEMIDQAVAEATAACTEAVRKIRDLMGNADANVALRAANSLLDHVVKLRETAALRKLAELEERLDGKGA